MLGFARFAVFAVCGLPSVRLKAQRLKHGNFNFINFGEIAGWAGFPTVHVLAWVSDCV